jgi:hypothetical protein
MLLFAGERPSQAYVQYKTSTGVGVSLRPSCLPLPLVVYPGTFSGMTVAEITAAVTAAGAAWSAAANPCTFLQFDVTVVNGPAPRVVNDGITTIVFRDTSWCPLDASGVCDINGATYDPATPALTTLFWSTSTGKIVDGDIEINAHTFSWADRVAHPELTYSYDLQNVLTHEFGHLLGLDNPCFIPGGGGTRPNDNTGQPVPDCATAPASVQATTLFPSTAPGDLEKRTLEPDDRAGLCAIYPAAASPCPAGAVSCACPPPGDGGQDAGGSNDAGAVTDAQPADASSVDAGKKSSGGGCNCETAGRSDERSWPACPFLAVALGVIARRRKRRRILSSDERRRAVGGVASSAGVRARTKHGHPSQEPLGARQSG